VEANPEKNTVELNRERCKGCYLCLNICPNALFSIDKKANKNGVFPVLMENADYCLNCQRCVEICPDQALLSPGHSQLNWSGIVYWASFQWHQFHLQRRGKYKT